MVIKPINQTGARLPLRKFSDKLHAFLANVSIAVGHIKGKTCLPLPPSEPASGANANYKDKVHLLESAVITWTKQIKYILKQDPEALLKRGSNPTPDVEIDFWKHKSTNLNSIFDQLQSDKVRKVLRFLDLSKAHTVHPLQSSVKRCSLLDWKQTIISNI